MEMSRKFLDCHILEWCASRKLFRYFIDSFIVVMHHTHAHRIPTSIGFHFKMTFCCVSSACELLCIKISLLQPSNATGFVLFAPITLTLASLSHWRKVAKRFQVVLIVFTIRLTHERKKENSERNIIAICRAHVRPMLTFAHIQWRVYRVVSHAYPTSTQVGQWT